MQFMTEAKHGYLSTACFHGLCGECRLECKFCGTPCLCQCHWKRNRGIVHRKLMAELEEGLKHR
jgi:hypothetical protein